MLKAKIFSTTTMKALILIKKKKKKILASLVFKKKKTLFFNVIWMPIWSFFPPLYSSLASLISWIRPCTNSKFNMNIVECNMNIGDYVISHSI